MRTDTSVAPVHTSHLYTDVHGTYSCIATCTYMTYMNIGAKCPLHIGIHRTYICTMLGSMAPQIDRCSVLRRCTV